MPITGNKQYSKLYNYNQAKYYYELYRDSGLSYNKIALSKKLNPSGYTPQWIQTMVKGYIAKFGDEKGGDN